VFMAINNRRKIYKKDNAAVKYSFFWIIKYSISIINIAIKLIIPAFELSNIIKTMKYVTISPSIIFLIIDK
jgi:predicted nucleotidyltransferase